MGIAIHSANRAISVNCGASAETRSNHRNESEVPATKTIKAVVPPNMNLAKRTNERVAPCSSNNATTTSLNATPKLRNMKIVPESTGKIARDSNALGMRLMAALPIGITNKVNSEVMAKGI
jgi:hypothetical protein